MEFRIGILISGNGSNMVNIIDACEEKRLNSRVVLVIADKLDAGGINKAVKRKINTVVLEKKKIGSKLKFEKEVLKNLKNFKINLLCLAGFMQILSEKFIKEWKHKILNIHPSLLPKYKGLNTHQKAIENKDKYSGCTVHFVNAKLDSGKIILQKRVNIYKKDTPDSLGKRILAQEHKLYPKAILKIFSL